MARVWTKEQQEAIDTEGTNIIVSAGAGSGKTAVLTERVLRKLKQGIHINQLLVLTFTKNAAFEMKERIRKAIKKEPSLKEELDLLDGAYITTFDSFALSIVKKYHTLKNITPHVQISEPTILLLEKKKTLNEIIDTFYQEHDVRWERFISHFFKKDDQGIVEALLTIDNQLDMRYDKDDYLANYISSFFDFNKIEKDIDAFTILLLKKINQIEEHMKNISSYVEGDYFSSIEEILIPLLKSKSYDEIKKHLDLKLPMLPKGSEQEAKREKEEINLLLKELKSLAIYEDRNAIVQSILSTKEDVSVLVDILIKLNQQMKEYKQKFDLYEFHDIAKIAITLLEENKEISEEMRDAFQEILIDEYQDTNDLQEHFISLIANHNVYMVGDIKQSIYRFRNANPYIFKQKYDLYSKGLDGIKIDLNKNFRSRKEPLDNINLIFKAIMDDFLGGADYQSTHQMIFGNLSYVEQGNTNQNHNLEIYNYHRDKNFPYSKEEIEIFCIAQDIQEKIANQYLIFDKDEGIIRPIRYDDFVILIDRTTQFGLYKKIFEYLNIPLTVYQDENITSSQDISMLKNLLRLIIEVKENRFDVDFRHCFMSVGRSFLFRYSDQELFSYFVNNNFTESTLYQKIKGIVEELDHLTCVSLLERILEVFDYDNKLITVGNVEEAIIRMEYFRNLSKTVSNLGYGIEEFLNYVELIYQEGLELKISRNKEVNNSCKIMTIHKSKGLEYHICYYAGLSNSFNIKDLNEKFLYDQKYGLIIPYYDEGTSSTIYKTMLKEEYLREEISEKIRLFYVALTRCKEKMIMVASINEEEAEEIDQMVLLEKRMKYRSFLDILNSIQDLLIPFIKNIEVENISLSKKYQYQKEKRKTTFDLEKQIPIDVVEYTKTTENMTQKTFSKTTNHFYTQKVQEELAFGKQMHYLLEILDWKNPRLDQLPIDDFIKEKLQSFLNQELIKSHKNDRIYREYEFMDQEGNNFYHGVIDLLIETEEKIYLVDYKLQNTQDENYKQQLKGYQRIIETRFGKTCTLYLYSILNGTMEKIV